VDRRGEGRRGAEEAAVDDEKVDVPPADACDTTKVIITTTTARRMTAGGRGAPVFSKSFSTHWNMTVSAISRAAARH
jgi:hypothetical protein